MIHVKVRLRDIPRPLAALGAHAADSLAPLGVLDGDLVYVRTLSDIGAARAFWGQTF